MMTKLNFTDRLYEFAEENDLLDGNNISKQLFGVGQPENFQAQKAYDIDIEKLSYQQSQREKLENSRFRNDTNNRNKLAWWTCSVVSVWLLCVFIILFLSGLNTLKLSDNVLMVLLGTTTFNILGLAFIVLKGYFEK